MKYLLFVFLCVFSSILSGQSFKIHGVTSPKATHPWLLMDESDERELQELIATEPIFRKVHNTIVSECDDLLFEELPVYTLIGRRLLAVARESRRRIFYLSYAWRMTRDERYLRRAERELLAVASFPDWNPSHFLDAAELTMACGIGLDWLYQGLSPETRDLVAQAIIDKGLMPSFKPEYSKWLKFANNWNQVCNAGMVFGALAVKDRIPDLAMNIIRRSVKSVPTAMRVYEPDGGYPEGYGYWAYGTTFNVLMISALEKEAGLGVVPLNNGFLKTGYYLRHMAGPSGQNFNYSDNHPVVPLNPAMFWFARKNNDPSILYNEVKLLQESRHLHRVRELPAVLLWARGLRLSDVPKPRELVWAGTGENAVATLRSGWSDESLFIGLKAGSPSASHGHMDVGSFVFDALGERWATDLPPQNYHSLEKAGLDIWRYKQDADRWRVFRFSNQSHNTITINDKPLISEAGAGIKVQSEDPGFLSCVSDLTPMYGQPVRSLKRGVGIVGNTEAFVQDEIVLDVAGKMNWKMLTSARVEIIDKSSAMLHLNGKHLRVDFELPPAVRIKTWSADPPELFDAPNPGYSFLGFETTLEGRKGYTFRVTMKPQQGSGESNIVR